MANAVADGHITVVPEVLVTGGGGGSFDGLAATLMRYLGTNGKRAPEPAPAPLPPEAPTALDAAEVAEDESRPDASAHDRRRDVVEQLAAVVGRERDVAGVEGDAVEVLVAHHVTVVEAVREHAAEREAELAEAVAARLGAGIGERQVDVDAVGVACERVVARGAHRVEEVVADGTRGDDAVVVIGAVVDREVAVREDAAHRQARRRPRRVDRRAR